jgi:hypothetical protein
MRLLHTTSFQLQVFSDNDIPRYAILSHTWDKSELTCEDLREENFRQKPGFAKLKASCAIAAKDGYTWIWIDTCCIDKSSSAELSEGINSMFRYYGDSDICYAYLADFQSKGRSEHGVEKYKDCRWWSRGWTLQELIAPRRVQFYSSTWRKLQDKRALANTISSITGIPLPVLRGTTPRSCNVAQRMSWASKRETTRNEDIAYCLIGLFDVQMVPIYGEGVVNAFLRLEEEILKRTADHTLFLWTPGHEPYNQGLLATSPQAFCTHRDCFDWGFESSSKAANQPFNPYKYFVPLSRGAASIRFSATEVIYEKGNTASFPALGPHGVQGNFLMQKPDRSKVSVQKICLDVIHSGIIELRWNHVCLNLMLEYPMRPSGLSSRTGQLKRLCATNKSSRLVLKPPAAEFQREQISVSQISAPDVDINAKFSYRFEPLSEPILGQVIDSYFERVQPAKEVKITAGMQIKQSGALLLRHTCPTNHTSSDFVLFFGAHNSRPTFWCFLLEVHYFKRRGFSIHELGSAYDDVKLSSGRFQDECGILLGCKIHNASADLVKDKDNEEDEENIQASLKIRLYPSFVNRFTWCKGATVG